MLAAVQRSWSWTFEAPPEALWPVLSDTRRFNEAAGFPRYVLEENTRADGSVEHIGHAKIGPLRLTWEEPPFDFVEGRWFSQTRRFRGAPIREMTARLDLEPLGGGSAVRWTLSIAPANLFGRLALGAGFLRRAGVTIDKLVRQGAAFVAGERGEPFDVPAPDLPTGARERVLELVLGLEGDGHAQARQLGDLLLTGSEADVGRIRPRRLARNWGAEPREAIELCLAGAKRGLLDMRWDLLCPRCRGAKATSASLDELPRGAHCSSCNVDYDRDFTRNVEVTFRPAAAVRRIAAGGFCLSSPGLMPHVKVQQALQPGEERQIDATLVPGAYRLRTREVGGERDITYEGGPFPSVIVDGLSIDSGPPAHRVLLRNAGSVERTVVIESRAWVAEALTAHEVTTMQAFRDLFGAETLRPGDDVEINQVTLMFTDLKGSTALYSRIGDARAYGIVREHFAFLGRAIRQHDGAIVKTIGDAVMAAFAAPADAVRAALAVQREIGAFNRAAPEGGVIIKLGLHAGPCIAVTLNDRLDYFGSTVNLAARLQGRSEGEDIVMSATLARDPAVKQLLCGLPIAAETATLKGFDAAIPYFRIRARMAGSRAAGWT
jgi:class 3 adenylate cyclase